MAKFKFSDIAYNITDKKMPVSGDEILYIGLEHMDSGNLRVTRWGSKVPLIGEKLVMKKGDILFGRRNTYLRRASIAPHDGLFSAHGMIFRPKTNVIDKEYFPFFIASDYFIDEAIKISVGSLSPTVNWGTLKELEFELPSLEKQRKLAKILWAAEETKQAYKKLLQKTDDMVKAKFEEMFGNKEEGFKYQTIKLKDVCNFKTGGTPSRKHPEFFGGQIPWITTIALCKDFISEKDAQDFLTKEGIENSTTHVIPKNSLLFGCRVGVGKSSINTCEICTNQDVVALIGVNPKKFDLLFIKKVLEQYNDYFDLQKRGATIKGIPVQVIKDVDIPCPSLDIQKEFTDCAQQIAKSKQQLQKSLDILNTMMRALINQSFN